MTINTEKYIRKPLYVDAVQVTNNNFNEICTWCQGEQQYDPPEGLNKIGKKYIRVRVHNPKNPRQSRAYVGDWLLYTERGYKVYTSKAFYAAFDKVGQEELPVENTLSNYQLPNFYFDPASDELTEKKPGKYAKPLELSELINIIRNEVVGTIQEPGFPFVEEIPSGVRGSTVGAEEVEFVPATPQSIADAVMSNEEVERQYMMDEAPVQTVESVPEQEKVDPAAVEGKHVLSIEEQTKLTADEIRDLVQSGEAVLIQDISQS
jgi:ASC-1-like (ASCH) protein